MNESENYEKGPGVQVEHMYMLACMYGRYYVTTCQVPLLKMAASVHPSGDWWIKVDSCDLSTGLMESVQGKWAGDVDLNDGEVSKLFQNHQQKKDMCEKLGLKEPRSVTSSYKFRISEIT